MRCPCCDSEMERGFLIDHDGHGRSQVFWSSGYFWSYMLDQTRVLPVSTYRCGSCGLLQSVAVDPTSKNERPLQGQGTASDEPAAKSPRSGEQEVAA